MFLKNLRYDNADMDRSSPLPWKSRWFLLAIALTLAAYALLLVNLARTRKPWNDEAMSASAGYTLATKGYMAIPSFDEANPGMSGIHRHMYYIFPLQIVVMAPWYRIFGFSLFTTRMLSMFLDDPLRRCALPTDEAADE